MTADLIDILIGVVLTIIGVVVVEFTVDFIRGKNEREKLLNSLNLEIINNASILNQNMDAYKIHKRDGYFLFSTSSYQNLKMNLESYWFQQFGVERLNALMSAYTLSEEFNRKFGVTSNINRSEEKAMMNDISRYLHIFNGELHLSTLPLNEPINS
jgi:hypothetical protein